MRLRYTSFRKGIHKGLHKDLHEDLKLTPLSAVLGSLDFSRRIANTALRVALGSVLLGALSIQASLGYASVVAQPSLSSLTQDCANCQQLSRASQEASTGSEARDLYGSILKPLQSFLTLQNPETGQEIALQSAPRSIGHRPLDPHQAQAPLVPQSHGVNWDIGKPLPGAFSPERLSQVASSHGGHGGHGGDGGDGGEFNPEFLVTPEFPLEGFPGYLPGNNHAPFHFSPPAAPGMPSTSFALI